MVIDFYAYIVDGPGYMTREKPKTKRKERERERLTWFCRQRHMKNS